MTSPAYQDAIKAIAKLSRQERVQLRAHLSSLLSVGTGTDLVAETHAGGARAVVGQLLKFVKSIGLSERDSTMHAIDQILNSKIGKGALEKCEDVWKFVCNQTDNRLHREAILQLGFRLHYDELRTWMDVVSVNELLRFLERVPAAIDSQFPGYAANRMLHLVVGIKKR